MISAGAIGASAFKRTGVRVAVLVLLAACAWGWLFYQPLWRVYGAFHTGLRAWHFPVADAEFVARFKREATLAANLNHPNIVAVYDFNEFDGMPYVVMQFVDGRTLKDITQKQKLATHQILNIIRPIADALTYAHWRGILHRDVKPSNVMLASDGAGLPRAVLMDFGLARAAAKYNEGLR